MRPSSRLYLDPDVIFRDRRARQRAKWLFDYVSRDVRSSPELRGTGPGVASVDEDVGKDEALRLVAEVADGYPRLLAWLTEGQVGRYWNVFGLLIAVVRLIPGVRWVTWRILFEPVAQRAPWRLALYEVILEEERNKHNKSQNAGRLSAKIAVDRCTPGLSAVTDMTRIAPTATREDLRTKIERMSSGCIGVSGLRGAGKTSLLHDFCRRRYGTPTWIPPDGTELPGLRLKVRAPLRYDARDFLVHLYACLCEAVLVDSRLNPTSFVDRVLLSVLVPRSIRLVTLLRGLTGIVLFALAGSLAYHAASGSWPLVSWPLQTWEWLGVAIAVVAAMVVISWPTRQALIELRQIRTLATDAQTRLERLHFQRTDTRGRGGTLGGPLGTGLNLSSTQAFTEQMMTLPELIDDYRDFAERVVGALQGAIGARTEKKDPSGADKEDMNIRLVVGIDEMDRIDDAQNANKFLTELSSVFGTSQSVYLISISSSTLAASGEQMIPLKTASNGIFDDIVWVEPLDLPGAGNLLDRRVIGLPAAFVALCYVLSGGLPRDLLRIARAIFTVDSGGSKELSLADVTEDVINDELRALKHRATAQATGLEIPATPDLLELLSPEDRSAGHAEASGGSSRSSEIEAIMKHLSQLWAGNARQHFTDTDGGEVATPTAEICDSFLAGIYFLLTVCQLFTAEPDLVTKLVGRVTGETFEFCDSAPLRNLARARTTLGVNPYLATEIIQETRRSLAGRTDHPISLANVEPAFLNPPPAHRAGQPS